MTQQNLFQKYIPVPPTTVNVPTYPYAKALEGSGITGSIYGGQIPTMTTTSPVPAIPKSQDRGFGSDLASSLGTLGRRTLELGGALGKAVDPTGGAFAGFLQGQRGREMFDPKSIIGAGVAAAAPDMGGWQRVGTALQPVGNVFSEFQDVLSPLQSEIVGRIGFGSQAMTNSGKTYEEISKGYREQGYNWLEAGEKARQEHDVKALDVSKGWIESAPEWMQTPLNFVVPEKITPYGAGEFILDPLIFVPLGKGGSAAGKAARLNKVKQTKLFDDPNAVVKNQAVKKELSKTKPTDNIVDDIGDEVPLDQPLTGTKQVEGFKPTEVKLVGIKEASGINVSNTGKLERLRNWLGGVIGDNEIY